MARALGPGSSVRMCGLFMRTSLDDGLGLLAHVEGKVVERADGLARGARALPSPERLVAGPGPGGGALGTVHVGHPGLDVVEEVAHLVLASVAAGGEPQR